MKKLDKKMLDAMKYLDSSISIQYKRSKLDIFEEWVGNIALFILSPLIIIMLPLIILATKCGGE